MPSAKQPLLAGYDYARVQRSPVELVELARLQAAASSSEEDKAALRRAAAVLAPPAEALVDEWRKSIG